MNDAPKSDETQIADFLHKLLRDHETSPDGRIILLVSPDQARVILERANFWLSYESAKRLGKFLKGPSRFLGPLLIAFALWKAGVISGGDFFNWLLGH